MVVFLIIVAVLAVLFTVILSLSATFTVVYDKGWSTKIKVLFIEKEISLSKLLSLVLFADKPPEPKPKPAPKKTDQPKKEPKPNPIKKMWDEEGIVGILSFVTNLLETANSAVLTLFRGLHIYSLYVMILVGGPDADMIARLYGKLCSYYYPVKGLILNGMRVDNYDDYVQPDFIADRTEFEFQLIGSISVGLLLKVAFKAGILFLKNLINNKNNNKKGD